METVLKTEIETGLKCGQYEVTFGYEAGLLWPPGNYSKHESKYTLVVIEDQYQTHGNGD